MDLKLELVPIPVADVDRAKAFYAGRRDSTSTTTWPSATPASCSSRRRGRLLDPGRPGRHHQHARVGAGAAPGRRDIHAARAELIARGVDVAEVVEMKAEGKPTVRYAAFSDPDGNTWTLQSF